MRRASLVLFSALLCYGLETRASWEVVPLAATPDAIGHAERDVRDAADHSSEGYVGPVTTSPLLAQQDAATAIERSRQPQALLDAIRRDDTKRLRSLLRLGINPDTRDQDGTPALMLASLFGSPDALRLLLDRGANPNTTQRDRCHGVDVGHSGPDEGRTPPRSRRGCEPAFNHRPGQSLRLPHGRASCFACALSSAKKPSRRSSVQSRRCGTRPQGFAEFFNARDVS